MGVKIGLELTLVPLAAAGRVTFLPTGRRATYSRPRSTVRSAPIRFRSRSAEPSRSMQIVASRRLRSRPAAYQQRMAQSDSDCSTGGGTRAQSLSSLGTTSCPLEHRGFESYASFFPKIKDSKRILDIFTTVRGRPKELRTRSSTSRGSKKRNSIGSGKNTSGLPLKLAARFSAEV